MHAGHKVLGTVLLGLFAFSCFVAPCLVWGQTSSVDSSLQAANDAVNASFNDVLSAEKAGANVTSLLNQLNGAADLLAQAQMDYRTGNFVSAAGKADGVVPLAQQISSAAQFAKTTASVDRQNAFWFSIGFSVFASIVLVLSLLLAWRQLKRYYGKSLSGAKPELTIQ